MGSQSHSSSSSTSYVNSQGAGASSSSSATGANGQTSTSQDSTFISGADSSGASASATASDAGASTLASAFAGDATDIILWHNAATEEILLWALEGADITKTHTLSFDLGVGWSIEGVDDLTGDGNLNLIWRHQTTGELIISGITDDSPRIAQAEIPSLDWVIEATSDLNNDGIDDILWHNAANGDVGLWLMNEQGQAGSYHLLSNVSGDNWSVGGMGDFNQDGQVDILWEDTNTDFLHIWVMQNNQFTHQVLTIDAAVDESWGVKGVGDYNSDGYDDILWLNTNGNVGLWYMQGTSVLGYDTIQGPTGEGWSLTI